MTWYQRHTEDGAPVGRPLPEKWARVLAAYLTTLGQSGRFKRCEPPEPRPRTEFPVGSREAVAARMRLRAKFGGRK